jgi:nucleoside-diphosphate-sugar epimerase
LRRLVVGCGYLGGRVACDWAADGDTVYTLTRSAARADRLAKDGFSPLVGDLTLPASLPALPDVDTVLMSVGFDRSSGRSIEEVYVEGLRHLLDVLPRRTQRIVYTSSTGVFGQTDGSVVDEQSVCRPQRAGGRACLEAEQLLLSGRWRERCVILRLAGIYGPGRLPRLQQLRAGAALATSADGLLNLIHVEDATLACRLAADADLQLPLILLTSDGHPVDRRTFYTELARLAGAPAPRFAETYASPAAADRARSSKRVTNRRLLERLGIKLRYPDFRQGLAAIAESLETEP